jgi:hypothetical protein
LHSAYLPLERTIIIIYILIILDKLYLSRCEIHSLSPIHPTPVLPSPPPPPLTPLPAAEICHHRTFTDQSRNREMDPFPEAAGIGVVAQNEDRSNVQANNVDLTIAELGKGITGNIETLAEQCIYCLCYTLSPQLGLRNIRDVRA